MVSDWYFLGNCFRLEVKRTLSRIQVLSATLRDDDSEGQRQAGAHLSIFQVILERNIASHDQAHNKFKDPGDEFVPTKSLRLKAARMVHWLI